MPSMILVLMGYFAFFAILHSLLADPKVKDTARELVPSADRWYRLAFVLLASAMVQPFLYILVFLPGKTLYVVHWPWNLPMIGGQLLAALGLLAAIKQTGTAQFLGLSQMRGDQKERGLVTDKFYCHLRNPLFFFGMLFLWLFPRMTESLLVFNLLASLYFYVGALHEEKSLRKEFGQIYEEYRQRVPMFLPRLRCMKK